MSPTFMRSTRAHTLVLLAASSGWLPGLAFAQTDGLTGSEATKPAERPAMGWTFEPDAGFVYRSGDFRVVTWGFAERAIDPRGPDYFRRVRQGIEVDLPRVSQLLRPAFVYEIDLTNTNFFGDFGGASGHVGRRNFENLFVSLQNPDDPGKFRVLFGQNTHILSREDNLSSGNLPTINRSLILEEHGSVNSFGTQFGIQVQKALSNRVTVQVAALDNRGSLNTPDPRYSVGNSLSGKILFTPMQTDDRKLTTGVAVDTTGDIRDRAFTLATSIGGRSLGSVPATGRKNSGEADIACTFPWQGRATTWEAEGIYSHFSGSNTYAAGGYTMLQHALIPGAASGDLDVFARYDIVRIGGNAFGHATQQAWRVGLNYNLPGTRRLANLHLEYARNRVSGPSNIVTDNRPGHEIRAVLRVSLQRYMRH